MESIRYLFLRDLKKTWPVFLAGLLLFVGSGLLEIIISYRASVNGFDSQVTGIVMTAFYVGFLLGTLVAPQFISFFRHAWAFRLYAGLVVLTAYLLAVSQNPVEWTLLQVVNGISMGGLYVVIESWLNLQSCRKSRGFLLSLYMMCWYAGLAMGQVFLSVDLQNLADYFYLVCLMVTLSIIFITVPALKSPVFSGMRPFSLGQLREVKATSLSGSFFVGTSVGCIAGMAPVFAHSVGLSIQQVAFFCVSFIVGAVFSQFPVALLGARLDHLSLKLWLALSCVVICLGMFYLESENIVVLLGSAFLIGGLSFPIYSLSITHGYNNLKSPDAALSASAGLLLVNGLGAAIGPLLCGYLMGILDDVGFFLLLAVAHLLLAIHLVSQLVFSKQGEAAVSSAEN
ncbi:MFS transporter [Emcibacter sp.]|uniref:MFS transporter n=1 Tax=Emcibacter sp. TaxID=1979954 RepID=UPI002AA7859D|nr:MFS transporter [Emcibacter sp.]